MAAPEIIPYGQHYRCMKQIIGDAAAYTLFEHLLDEYAFACYKSKTSKVIMKRPATNELSNKTGMNRRTVDNGFATLEGIGLISVNEEQYLHMDTDRCVSLCRAFLHLNAQDKVQFRKALKNKDEKILEGFGYSFQVGSGDELFKLEGGIVQNDAQLCRNAQSCADLHNLVQKYTSLPKNIQDCADLHNVVQKCTSLSGEICAEICNSFSKSQFKEAFYDKFAPFFTDPEGFDALVDYIYSGSADLASLMFFLAVADCAEIHNAIVQKYTITPQKVVQKYTTEIKEGNKKEINGSNDYFDSFDDSSDEQEFPVIKFNEESYKLSKKKSSLPYFTRKEISIFQQSPDLCVDRADKIFIYCIWDNLLNHFFQDIEDEDGNVATQTINPEGEYILMDDMYKNILLPAFERTNDMIALGKLDCEKGVFEITTQEPLDPDTVDLIVDFDIKGTSEGRYYVIDSGKLHDTHAAPIQVSRKPEGMRTSEYNKRYIQEIIKMGDDDSRYEQLTTIELFIYNFLNEFFEISDDLEVVDVNEDYRSHPFLNQSALKKYFLQHQELTVEEFLSVTKAGKVDQDGAVTFELRMFPADKIQGWNEKHKEQSAIVIE